MNSGDFKNWAIPQASHPLGPDPGRRRAHSGPTGRRDSRRCCEQGAAARRLLDLSRELLHGASRAFQRLAERSRAASVSSRPGGVTAAARITPKWRSPPAASVDSNIACCTTATGRTTSIFQRFQRYTTYQAAKWHRERRRVSLAKMFLNLPFRFLACLHHSIRISGRPGRTPDLCHDRFVFVHETSPLVAVAVRPNA